MKKQRSSVVSGAFVVFRPFFKFKKARDAWSNESMLIPNGEPLLIIAMEDHRIDVKVWFLSQRGRVLVSRFGHINWVSGRSVDVMAFSSPTQHTFHHVF